MRDHTIALEPPAHACELEKGSVLQYLLANHQYGILQSSVVPIFTHIC